MGFLQDFKKFALRGNVLDLAVGIIIGAAFGKITTSLVNDVLMPPLGLATAGIDFRNLAVVLEPAKGEAPAVAVRYGLFIAAIIDFVIIALCVFLLVRIISKLDMNKPKEVEVKKPPEPTREEVLLAEIRDELRNLGRA